MVTKVKCIDPGKYMDYLIGRLEDRGGMFVAGILASEGATVVDADPLNDWVVRMNTKVNGCVFVAIPIHEQRFFILENQK